MALVGVTWPTDVPGPLLVGLQEELLVTANESRPPAAISCWSLLSGILSLTRQQFSSFEYYYAVSLQFGALPLEFKHPVWGNCVGQFARQPTYEQISGNNVQVSIAMRLELPIYEGLDSATYVANTDWPTEFSPTWLKRDAANKIDDINVESNMVGAVYKERRYKGKEIDHDHKRGLLLRGSEQYKRFIRWYHIDLARGALTFNHPKDGLLAFNGRPTIEYSAPDVFIAVLPLVSVTI